MKENKGQILSYDEAMVALVENNNNLEVTKKKLLDVAGGQYYRKRKTRKPKKTRKSRKTQRK